MEAWLASLNNIRFLHFFFSYSPALASVAALSSSTNNVQRSRSLLFAQPRRDWKPQSDYLFRQLFRLALTAVVVKSCRFPVIVFA
jgi:hypothetical protein